MLWTVLHLWPSGARFVFNCYCHHSLLVPRNGYGTSNILHSREGVTQGNPLATVAYNNKALPPKKCQKSAYTDVTQSWYADDSGALGTFDKLEQHFNSLKHHGPDRGYYPKPTKIILIVHIKNIEAGELFGRCHGFKVCVGASYLRSYIRDEKPKGDLIKKRTEKWERDIHTVTKMEEIYTQESYAAAACAIQSEWIFLQHAIKDTGQAFAGLEKFMQENFLPRILFGRPKTLPPVVGALSKFPVKKYGTGLQNPVTPEKEKYNSSLRASCKLIGTITSKR